MLEINISDHHFGKLAWPSETGHEPYDVQIAQAMFMRALNTLIERSRGYKFDQILFVVGNDLLNSDNAENTTTAGTVVTTDIRYHKTFRTVRYTLIEAIEKLKLIAPVKVLVVPGNHDQLAAWHMGDSLESWYRSDKNVTVENDPRYRKYHEFGKVLLAFTHGDKGSNYPMLMASEEPEAWARTKFREVHTGHRHCDKVTEDHGVKVRILPALCPADDWNSSNGYVSNQRQAEAFIWNKDQGLIATVIYNDDAFDTLKTKRAII
jgi:3',5'-cyclic AMP phosphodiesterase CpdA